VRKDLENIDEVFKKAFDGFESNVDPSVWSNVQNSIGSSAASSSVGSIAGKSIVLKIVAGVIALGTLVTGAYFALENDEEKKNKIAVNTPLEVSKVKEEKSIHVLENHKEQVSEKTLVDNDPFKEVQENNSEALLGADILEASSETVKPIKKEGSPVLVQETASKNSSVVNAPTVISEKTNNSKEEAASEIKVEEQLVVNSENVSTERNPEDNWRNEEELELVEQVNIPFINKAKIPRTISPNGDGIGDVIKIEGENIKEFKATIFNISNGKTIYEWNLLDGFWDGSDMSGDKVLPGTYMLLVTASGEDGRPIDAIKQTITVLK
tara:strand:- start:14691 stop:15662 length:972 start_codon:yes stop_codon:yes gene_type:complete